MTNVEIQVKNLMFGLHADVIYEYMIRDCFFEERSMRVQSLSSVNWIFEWYIYTLYIAKSTMCEEMDISTSIQFSVHCW